MSAPPSDTTRHGPLSSGSAEELAAELAGEMIARWQQGERVLPEELLQRYPELWDHPEAAADLIYEEVSLRQEYGADVPLEEVFRRFPQWRPQLEVLFDCQRLLGPRQLPCVFPEIGQTFGDFLLCAELGRGAQGPVFLARQQSLGGRPVVLKLTPREAGEHLSLARLQHTHIVPLYCVQDDPARGLRALCMPYFGGTTLAQLLETLGLLPPALRTGQDLLNVLDRASRRQEDERIDPLSTREKKGLQASAARHLLARASYIEAVCWIGACLADALQYAHERGLVHLDLKPSNILLAADGQPMLLDFHLAREPLQANETRTTGLGGTKGYLSPEQEAALLAVGVGRPPPLPVDGRSDVYSLGLVLHEALTDTLPASDEPARTLRERNPEVSPGLADVLARSLARDANRRYPDMAAFSADLRRHLAHLPLAGVRNRSLAERWRKWRRRRPYGIALAGMMFAVLLAAAAVVIGAFGQLAQRLEQARSAQADAQVQMKQGDWEGAHRTLLRGRAAIRGLPFQEGLAEDLDRDLAMAERGRAEAERAATVRTLHQLADRVRFLFAADGTAPRELRPLADACQDLWEHRGRILERVGAGPDTAVREDLLDLAIFWSDLQVHLETPPGEAHVKALQVLDEAEALFGPSAVLDLERQALGRRPQRPQPLPKTAWEHYALGRAFLRLGDVEHAAREVVEAVRMEPEGLWPNFYQGLCALRQGRAADAVTAYSVCIGAAPTHAACFHERARAYLALKRLDEAQRDFGHAAHLDPTLASASLGRELLRVQVERSAAVLLDLEPLLDPLR